MANIYIKDNNRIYKFRDKLGDYLLCTPWQDGEDRRYKYTDFKNPIKVNRAKALQEINEAWRATTVRWSFNGKKYETRGEGYSEKKKTHKEYTLFGRKWSYDITNYEGVLDLCPVHRWTHKSKYTNRNGEEVEYEYHNDYYIIMHQGKLKWTQKGQYIPQLYMYDFISIDEEPKHWAGWTNVNCVKPVYCITDKKFI